MAIAIRQQNESQILAILWASHTEPSRLESLMQEIQQQSTTHEWLGRLLNQRLLHFWFIAFKYAQPRELMAVFELDFFIEHTEPRRSRLNDLMQYACDHTLSVRYAGPSGIAKWADAGVNCVKIVQTLRPEDSLVTTLVSKDCVCFDDALLNPPYARVMEWTYFHIKMRRMAFLLMQQLIRDLDTGGLPNFFDDKRAVDQAQKVAHLWRTAFWRDPQQQSIVKLSDMRMQSADSLADMQAVQTFFSLPPDVQSKQASWARLVGAQWNQVQRELPCDNNALTFVEHHFYNTTGQDSVAEVDARLYRFIYPVDSQTSQSAFRARVLKK